MSKLQVQEDYLLFRRDELKTKKNGILLTEDVAKKQDGRLPIGKLVAKGPNSKNTTELDTYVMYDTGQIRVAFKYENQTYLVGLSTSILVETPGGTEGFESIA